MLIDRSTFNKYNALWMKLNGQSAWYRQSKNMFTLAKMPDYYYSNVIRV